MSRKTFCDMCGAEIKGNSAKIVAISAEYGDLHGCISSDDAMALAMDATRGFARQ